MGAFVGPVLRFSTRELVSFVHWMDIWGNPERSMEQQQSEEDQRHF